MSHRRSLIGLDWVNFFMADVETGVGPFVALYLSSARHWDPAQVGMVIAAQSISSVLAQTPAGELVDWSPRKAWLIVAASIVISLGCVFIVQAPNVHLEIANQIAIGAATALVAPTVAAISLGLVGKAAFGRRVGRNGGFSHAGNVVTALAAGWIGSVAGLQWIFFICAASGAVTILFALLIRNRDIDNQAARAAAGDRRPLPVRELLRDRRLALFAATVVIFHIANAPMLPLAGQEIARQHGASLYMTANIVVAQAVMIVAAIAAGRLAERWGRKPLFLIAFGALIARGLFLVAAHGPREIAAIETLDGLGTGIAGVLTLIIVSDSVQGSGRFNLTNGGTQACVGTGAFCGNLLVGMAAKSFGYNAAFLGLAAIAVVGALLFWLAMPETRDVKTWQPATIHQP